MAQIFNEESHTFSEYLLIPNLTTTECQSHNVNLKTVITRYKKGERDKALTINIPLVSAIMQSVSNHTLAIALAKEGGLSFIYGSQSAESEAEMVRMVKSYKAGIVSSDSNLPINSTLADALNLKKASGHSTIAVTDDGSSSGKLLGLLTSRDYRLSRTPLNTPIKDLMTPIERLVTAQDTVTLSEANDIIWEHKLNQLPIVDKAGKLVGLVFRKDYDSHKDHPNEILDSRKRLLVGAGINTRDYMTRVPLLIAAGVDVLCIDSSDGFSEWQAETLKWIKTNYPNMPVGAGNVVDADGFNYLADAGADFIKVGIGGGSICITRETKGIGCGQATAVNNVAQARDAYMAKHGIYIPICSDGGIVHDYHMTLALAMGADFIMLGRYFARFDESPTKRMIIGGKYVKEYWGEGSNRARNWQRYDEGDTKGGMLFEEGVDSYVPYAGSLASNVNNSLAKIKATMCSVGSLTIPELQSKARLVRVSATSIVEGGAHDVILKNSQSIDL